MNKLCVYLLGRGVDLTVGVFCLLFVCFGVGVMVS